MSKRLLVMNGLAILAIPIQHAAAYGLQAMFDWTDRYLPVEVPNFDQLGSPEYYFLTALRLLSVYSVPCFLFISGFFVAFMSRGKERGVALESLFPRLTKLLYPFLLWTAARFVLLRQAPGSINEVLDPYNFVPLLVQFYLLAPLLVRLARRNWKWLLGVVAVLQLVLVSGRYLLGFGVELAQVGTILENAPRWLFFTSQPFWFPLGIVYGLNQAKFNEFIIRHRRKWLAGAVIFAVAALAEYFIVDYLTGPDWIGPNFSGLTRLAFVFMTLFTLLSLEPGAVRYPDQLVEVGIRSFGIYLANIPFIYVVAVIMYRFIPALLGIHILYFAILFATGLFGPLVLMWLVRNSPLRIGYRYLFG